LTRRLPHGDWWWRALVLGTLNVGAFFVLVFVAAERLPSGVAATMMATSPAVMMLLAWPLVGERPRIFGLAGAAVGFLGVALLVLRAGQPLDPAGLAASLSAMVLSSVGFILGKRWRPPVPVLTFTAWQLLAGGLVLAPVALLVEGRPPHIDGPAVLGFLYVGLVATVLAYVVWFRGLQLLPAGTVGLIGLFNPVAGVTLGVAVAGEAFGPLQGLGAALVLAGIALGQRRRGVRRRRARYELARTSAAMTPTRSGSPIASISTIRPARTVKAITASGRPLTVTTTPAAPLTTAGCSTEPGTPRACCPTCSRPRRVLQPGRPAPKSERSTTSGSSSSTSASRSPPWAARKNASTTCR
jgi:drug/metabolite transporter (DMT)-like permease